MKTELRNDRYSITINDGIISGFYSTDFCVNTNLTQQYGKSGAVCFTYTDDDITSMPHERFTPYNDRISIYDAVNQYDNNTVLAVDTKNSITTEFSLAEDGLYIKSEAKNDNISEYGIIFDLNFLGIRGTDFQKQLLPTSPYTSSDGEHMFFIMTNPEGDFLIITAKSRCDGWKIDYSPQCFAHYILAVKFISSFDKAYGGSGKKSIELNIQTAKGIDEVFDIISGQYRLPICRPILNGGFDGYGIVKIYGDYDYLKVTSPSGLVYKAYSDKISMTEYGFYTVMPILDNQNGIDAVLWNGNNMTELFNRCCDAIKKPYHPDDNLCEGGCFIWALISNMRFNRNFKYEKIVGEELDIIMAKGEYVPRKTIVPHTTEKFGAYHIHQSERVQEQFFGVSILIEAYRLYDNNEIYEYMISSLLDLVNNYMRNGMIYNGSDYSTVCAPIITVVDAAILLKEKNDARYKIFRKAADEIVRFLYERGYNFPTEGEESELYSKEYEDGSISCTALSILYYCRYIERNSEYESFAYDVLMLHKAWTSYSPDAKMNGSSFRWWETIWEGDGEGPALCCGHAWTIWKGEALFHGGILLRNDKMLLDSWNAYITNFCKAEKDGTMYSCYEADYIRGGGDSETKPALKQLEGECHNIKYEVAHSYPKHIDNSLSRYAWVRAYYTWLKTAAVLKIDNRIIAINAEIENNIIKTDGNITQIYIGTDGFETERKLVCL